MLVSWARRTSASVTTCDNFLRSSRSRTDKYFKLIVLTTSWLKKSSPSNQQTTNWGHTHACTHAVLKYDGCIAHWRNTYSIILNSQLSLVSVTTTWLYHDNGWQLQETSVVRGYWNAIMPVTGPRFLRKEIFTIIIIDDSLEATVEKKIFIFSDSLRGRLGNSPRSTSRPRLTGWAPLC